MSKHIKPTNPTADWGDDEVRSFKMWCRAVGISPATGRRLLDRGKGPVITELSTRHFGVRGRHHRLWLDERVRT